MTLIRRPKAQFNAVYYPASRRDIDVTDQRESSYCRVSVPREDLAPLGLSALPQGHYWVYVQSQNQVEPVSKAYPLVQSYVDIFLSGCLQAGQKYQLAGFAKRCVQETTGWPPVGQRGKWVNDRVHPRRPFELPYAVRVDHLLADQFSYYYQHKID